MNGKWKRTKRSRYLVLTMGLMLAGTHAFGGNSWTDEYFASSCQLTSASINGAGQHFTSALSDDGLLIDPGSGSANDGTYICSTSLSTALTPSFVIRDITLVMTGILQSNNTTINPTCNIYIETKSGLKTRLPGNSTTTGTDYDAARMYFGCPALRSDGQVMVKGYKVNVTYVQSTPPP